MRPNTIDESKLNVKDQSRHVERKSMKLAKFVPGEEEEPKTINIFQKTENLNIALNAAKKIGCTVVNMGAQDIVEGRYSLSWSFPPIS